MRQTLKLHPDSRCNAVTQIEVEAVRPIPGTLQLRYIVTGNLDDLRLPRVTTPARADQLWRHTCFEAFTQALPGSAYYEFNFAPSTQWAAYRFSDYRSGMRVASEINAPRIEVQSKGEAYELQASLAVDGLAGLPSDALWCLGLAAVIEDASGHTSYWALAHPAGKPDFHHSDCFTHEIPAANSP